MRRRPQDLNRPSISMPVNVLAKPGNLGLVLSGGGSRAAYQTGVLRALLPYFKDSKQQPVTVIVGSSIGAINGLVTAACLKKGLPHVVDQLQEMWLERTFKNSFSGHPSMAFLRAIKIAALQYMSPGPNASSDSIFDPTPLMRRVDQVIDDNGGLKPEDREPRLESVAVMTTMEGSQRKPLLFLSAHKQIPKENMMGASFETCYVESLSAKHGFASAALPSVLPPVELDAEGGKVRLVDGGISQNVPVDPAVRMGAQRVIVIDVSGRHWWLDHYDEPHDSRPKWEVPAELETFCMRPPETFVVRTQKALGPLLKQAVGGRTSRFIAAVGPVWPLFTLLRKKLGEELAYEVMTYVALDQEYIQGLIEYGYDEATYLLKNKSAIDFAASTDYKEWAQRL